MANLLSYLNRFRELGSETAFVQQAGYRSFRWSYLAVHELACRFARELEARGINRGDRVMIWGPNCAEWAGAFFGCMLRGAVAVPMDAVAAPDFAARVFAQVEGKLLVCSRERAASSQLAPLLVLEDLPRSIMRHEPGRYPAAPHAPEDPLQIVFTSGATAEPKGVVITCGNLVANLAPIEAEIRRYLKYERIFHPLRFLVLLPLSHVFGQFMGMFVPSLLGATVVFQESLNPSEVIRRTRRERVSVIVTVPRLLGSLRGKIERDLEAAHAMERFRGRFASAEGRHFLIRWWIFRTIHREFGWKFWAFISGGAALDAGVEQFWQRLGFLVIQGYGLTESTSLISVNHPLKPGKGSIGKALPGREIRLDDDGEILVRGDNIAAGYLQASGLRPVLEKGWFHTGDLGAIDEGGNLYFKGRKKGVIVTAEGMKVHPEDLESALRRQPEVGDCVVIGLQQGGNAEPCAVLVLRDRAADPAAIVRSANASLAGYQHMRRWFVWPEEDLPRTSTQKPRTEVIRQLVESRLAGQDSASPRSGGIAELIARIVGQRAGSIPPAAGLTSELDLSSVDRVELLSAIEDRYQVDLEESQFTAATTLEDLEAMLHRPRTGPSGHKYPRWALSLPVRMVRLAAYDLLIRPLTRLLARPEIRGRQNLSKVSGPLLVISNHVTEVDACLILAALPPRFRRRLAVAMSGEMLRTMRRPPREMSPVKRVREMLSYWLVTGLFNVFPLPQESGFRESFAFAGEAADRGFSILVFPEGHRTRDGAIAPFQSGIGLLAKNLRLPVLPMRIDGLYEMKLQGRRSARRGEIVVSLGTPILLGSEEPPEAIARKLREQISSVPDS